MSARVEGLLLIALMITLSFVFQIQMKVFANKIAPVLTQTSNGYAEMAYNVAKAAISWRTILIGFLAVAIFLVWLLVLTRLDLSIALPVISLALVINAVGGGIWLGEPVTLSRLLGILIVAAGLILTLRS